MRIFLVGLLFQGLVSAATLPWEFTIPADATETKETYPNGRVGIEYSRHGQRVGFRIYDPNLDRFLLEQPYLAGEMHGVLRIWNEAGWLESASIWKTGQLHGPRRVWRADGAVERATYHVAGREVTREVYLAARPTDATLAPAELLDQLRGPSTPTTTLSAADEALMKQHQAALADGENKFRAPLDRRVTLQPVNPRAETLQAVWRAAQIAARIADPPTRLRLLVEAAVRQTEYGRRMFGYVGKTTFIDNAARILGLAQTALERLTQTPARSAGWLSLAEAWRELARIALWGEHANNKLACDREAKRCYDRAVQLDPDNQAAAAARAEANRPQAPRPTLPPAIAAAEPIAEERWEQAGLLRQALADGSLTEALRQNPPPLASYAGVGAELEVDAGPVTIVEFGQSDQAKSIPAGELYALHANTEVSTGSTGKARIVYDDGSVFHIRPRATLLFQDQDTIIIRQESFSSGSVVKDLLALFDSRTIRTDLRVSKRGREFLVITPTAVLGPRGTCFAIGREGDTESVRVYDGAVEIRTETGVDYVTPGEQASMRTGAPVAVTAIPAEDSLARVWPEANGGPPRAGLVGARLTFSWSPHGGFSPVAVGPKMPFGVTQVTARLSYPALARDGRVSITWRRDGEGEPLLRQEAPISARGQTSDATAAMPVGQWYTPGRYQVTMSIQGTGATSASFEIEPAPAVGTGHSADLYAVALASLGAALEAIQNADLPTARRQALAALPKLRAVLGVAAELPDIQCAGELAHAIIALGEMGEAAERQERALVIAWGRRVIGHGEYTATHAQNALFRQSSRELADGVRASLAQLGVKD